MVLKRAHHAGVKGILGCATDLNLAERKCRAVHRKPKETQSAPIAVHSGCPMTPKPGKTVTALVLRPCVRALLGTRSGRVRPRLQLQLFCA